MKGIFFYKQCVVLSLLVFNFLISQAFANPKLEKELLIRISKSQQELDIIQNKIHKESTTLANELEINLQKIKILREDAAAIQRVADEKLMSFEQLKNRVGQWSSQSVYQNHLLSSFVESSNIPLDNFRQDDGEILIDINAINFLISDLESRLSPGWKTKKIASSSGAFEDTSTLKVGPVAVAYSELKHEGGPLDVSNNTEAKVLGGIYQASEVSQLKAIYKQGRGEISFDPTLGNAYKIMNQGNNLLDHVEKGGVWALPILFFGLFSLIVSSLKAIQLIRLPKIDTRLADKLVTVLHADNHKETTHIEVASILAKAKGAQKKLIEIASASAVSQERDDLLVAYLVEYKYKIERFLGAIATSASIAPLLGLLGTVSGMITTFMMMKTFGTSDASTVSGGISEALITTELGLIVAIPSLIMSALLSRKTKSYNAKLEASAIKLSKVSFSQH